VPEDFAVLSVRLEDGTCYLNLPESCVHQLGMGDTSQRQTVIGLVRSLCSIRDVRRVRILVDGEWREMLGTVDISQPLTALS
jgi:spore germination protein GerM